MILKLQNKSLIDVKTKLNNKYYKILDNVNYIIYFININYNELFFYRTINDKNTKFMLYVDCEEHIMIKIKQYLDNNNIKYNQCYWLADNLSGLYIYNNYEYKFIIKLLNYVME